MRVYFDKPLRHRKKEGWVKLFDLVSEDFGIVGDVRCFSMYRRPEMPPNAGAMISEEVWMLEKAGAKIQFLVFGKDERVPEEWLKRYGHGFAVTKPISRANSDFEVKL